MNTYNINDINFTKTSMYEEFIKSNQGRGYLKIRAYAASQAIPVSNVKVIVSTNIDNNNVIFYEGMTNESGIIDKITLPAPKLDENNMSVPSKTIYEITATYNGNSKSYVYSIDMYDGICVMQNMNIIPSDFNNLGEL